VTRILIHTNVHERCGNAEYARDLEKQLSRWYDVTRSDSPPTQFDGEVVIMNWHPARVGLPYEIIQELRDQGKVVVIIWQNSLPAVWEAGYALRAASAVVAHEPMDISNLKVHYIPHGIPIVDIPERVNDGQLRIGTAGFPFMWKRNDVVAEAARRFGAKLILFGPTNEHFDAMEHLRGIDGHLAGNTEIVQDWLPAEDIIKRLAQCDVNIFWFETQKEEDTYGQSGSARLGIAARQPVILSHHRKFRTLIPYSEGPNAELYVAWEEEEVYHFIEEILSDPVNARKPRKVLKDQGWPVTGRMYKDLIDDCLVLRSEMVASNTKGESENE
jgi:hypothetical protein